MNSPEVKLVRRADGWWIAGLPWEDCPECGPYDNKREANEDRMGLERFIRQTRKRDR